MIRVVADTSRDAALIADAIGGAAHVMHGSGRFAAGDPQVECVVLGCRSPIPPGRLDLARAIKRQVPWAPVIFVTDPAPDVAEWLGESGVSDVVWFDDVQTELRSRVEVQFKNAALFAFAGEIEGSTLPPALRSALAHSLRAATDRPVRNVKELAEVLRRSPVTLSQSFRKNTDSEATLSGFLGALVILRAHQLRSSGLSWKVAGPRLGFTRPTLHAKSKKWPGLKLKELLRTPRRSLLATFASDFLEPLLNGPDRTGPAQHPGSPTDPMPTP